MRVLRRQGELGLDAMHVECMLVRLAGPMETHPQVDYEYDFVGGEVSGHRALDSAFVVEYDAPIDGERKWRQRNLTLVNDERVGLRRDVRAEAALEEVQSGTQIAHFDRGELEMALSVSEVLPGTRAATTRRQIWSIGGGKGGIGKSLLAASIGWQLARMGRRVVLVDADLGGREPAHLPGAAAAGAHARRLHPAPRASRSTRC